MRTRLFAVAGLSALALAAGACSGGAGTSGDTAAPASGGASGTAPAATTASGAAPAATTAAGAPATSAESPAEAPAGGTGSTGGAGDAALAADTGAICAQASRTSAAFGATFAEDHRLLAEAAGRGGAARANAEQKAARDMENFGHALRDMARLAADPGVTKALAAMGAQVSALKGDLAKLDDAKLAGLHATLDAACGRA